jgi:hypothetical protein
VRVVVEYDTDASAASEALISLILGAPTTTDGLPDEKQPFPTHDVVAAKEGAD